MAEKGPRLANNWPRPFRNCDQIGKGEGRGEPDERPRWERYSLGEKKYEGRVTLPL